MQQNCCFGGRFVSDNFRAADVVVVNNNVYLSKINPYKCLIRRHWHIAKNLLFLIKNDSIEILNESGLMFMPHQV